MAIAEFVGDLFLYEDIAENELTTAVDGEVGDFLLLQPRRAAWSGRSWLMMISSGRHFGNDPGRARRL